MMSRTLHRRIAVHILLRSCISLYLWTGSSSAQHMRSRGFPMYSFV
jgi:hypothetical protein